MKRTKTLGAAQALKMTGTKTSEGLIPKKAQSPPTLKQPKEEQSTKRTKDGRILGLPIEHSMPERLRNIIPPNSKTNWTKAERPHREIRAMTRKLFPAYGIPNTDIPIPLALQPDGEVSAPNKQNFRMNGLNQARFNALITAIRSGATMLMACRFAGIQYATFNSWINKGEQGIFPYSYVAATIREAQAQLEKTLIQKILDAGLGHEKYEEVTRELTLDKNTGEKTLEITKSITKLIPRKWQALAWYIERTNPDFRLMGTPEDRSNKGNTPEDDLLIMDGLTLGKATKQFAREE